MFSKTDEKLYKDKAWLNTLHSVKDVSFVKAFQGTSIAQDVLRLKNNLMSHRQNLKDETNFKPCLTGSIFLGFRLSLSF